MIGAGWYNRADHVGIGGNAATTVVLAPVLGGAMEGTIISKVAMPGIEEGTPFILPGPLLAIHEPDGYRSVARAEPRVQPGR